MAKQQTQTPRAIKSLELCSRCLAYELNSWVNDNFQLLSEEAKKQIREEIKTIRLKPGNCIVCNHNSISDSTSENIIRILEESNVSKKLREEFEKDFCLVK